MGIPATLSSVPAQTPYIQYVATSGQTVFPYPFEITQDSDLVVVANGTTLATDSGYTVSGVGASTGGNVTFTSGRAANDIITLFRDIPISRVSQIAQNSGFSSTVFNAEYNNVYLLLQQLQQNIDQCLQVPNTNNPAPTTTLVPANYANKYLAFDGNGNPTPAALTSSGSLTQAVISGLLFPQTAEEASAGITPVNTFVPSHDACGDIIVERYISGEPATNDCGVGFRNACLVAAQLGGGRIAARAPLYLFNTWDPVSFYAANNLALFCIPANTELAGGGMFYTKLRISQTARTGMYNGGANRTHIIGMRIGAAGQYVHDIEFDYDGIVQAASNDSCYFARTMSGQCIFERCYGIQAPIINGIVDSSTDTANGASPLGPTIVRDCWFQDCGPNMTGNSALSADLSYLYLCAPGSRAERNRLFNTTNANHNCGGIEMHASQYYAVGNYIKNCWPGMYLGVQDGVTISIGSVVESNYIGYNNAGIQIIDQHNGLKITKNHFEANCDSAGSPNGYSFVDIYTPLNSVTGVNSAGIQTLLSITNNSFDCTLYRQGTARQTGGTGTATSVLNVGAVLGFEFSHNLINSPGPNCIILWGSVTGATQDVVIEENELVNCYDSSGSVGYFNVFGSSASGYVSGPVLQDIYIRRNHVWRSRSLAQSSAYSFIATGGGSGPTPTITNVRFEDNDLININPATDIISATTGVTVNGQNTTAQSLTANGQTINTATLSSAIVTSGAAYTGLILQPGTYAGQTCRVINQSANTQTMAASGTSNVADGTSCVIPASRSMLFTWDIQTSLWYHD